MLSTPQSVEPAAENTQETPSETPKEKKTTNEKVIFLTFDDGPLKGTENVLKVLEKEQVPATMFMVGRHIAMNHILFQRAIASPYVTIANHTYSHADGHYQKFYTNNNALLKDINHTDAILSKAKNTEKKSAFYPLRLAGRNVFRLQCISCDDCGIKKCQRDKERAGYNTLAKAGFSIYGWDMEWRFNSKNGRPLNSAQDIVKKIEAMYHAKRARQNDKIILLMHDFMFRDCFNGQKNLATLIRLLKEKGWKFAGIEEYS